MVKKFIMLLGKKYRYNRYDQLAKRLKIDKSIIKDVIKGINLEREICKDDGNCYKFNITEDPKQLMNQIGIKRIIKQQLITINGIPKKGYIVRLPIVEQVEKPKTDYERIITNYENMLKEFESHNIYETIAKELSRKTRDIHTGDTFNRIIQRPIKKLYDDYNDFEKDPILNAFNDILRDNFDELNPYFKEIHRIIYKDNNIKDAHIKFFYVFERPKEKEKGETKGEKAFKEVIALFFKPKRLVDYRWSNAFRFNKHLTKPEFNIEKENSDFNYMFLGYEIIMTTNDDKTITNKTLSELKAYHPTCDRKYHEMTTASTSTNKICIYETFLDVCNIIKLRYSRKNKESHEKIMNKLKNEGHEIEYNVKNGNLIKSLQLLCDKYKKEVCIIFYGVPIYNNNDKIDNQNKPILITKNSKVFTLDKGCNMQKFVGKSVILYNIGLHVAPTIFKFNYEPMLEINKDLKKKNGFILKPTIKTESHCNKECSIYGFDLETYKNKQGESVPYLITLYGMNIEKELVKKIWYGDDCIINFVNYIDQISTKVNQVKSRPKEQVPKIYIYGFNNSNFDNLLIYNQLHNINPSIKIVFTGSSIKSIKHNNIHFQDISLFYKCGDLRKTCDQFKLTKEKGYFPYKFATSDTLYYIGNVPDLKYWNSEEDRNNYIKQNGDTFNMQTYSEKYCLLDSELVYELAVIHQKNCVGSIKLDNGETKYYDTRNAFTGASVALKMFQSVFLKEPLYQSPNDIIEYEKKAYKGGRTEVFKKCFSEEDIKLTNGEIIKGHQGSKKLHYYDINSSYPSSMTKIMPYKFKKDIKYDKPVKLTYDEITDYYLYSASSNYIGNDKHIIPNLLIRKNGHIIAVKQTDTEWHWGCELKEAILNGFEIYMNRIIMYEGKAIFKEYAEYFYNERLKIKSTNPTLANFYKLLLNSLYGKFGQRLFTKSVLLNNQQEFNEIMNGSNKLLNSFSVINNKLLISYSEDGDEYECIGKLMRFSSFIAANSRCNLSLFMRNVAHENVYYCDTDSCFTSELPDQELVCNKSLGKWKCEASDIQRGIFIAPKAYTFTDNKKDYHIKSKGIKEGLLTKEDYEDLLTQKEKTISKNMTMFNRSFSGIKIDDKAQRTVQPVYNKRLWNGNDSKPFENIQEWESFKINEKIEKNQLKKEKNRLKKLNKLKLENNIEI